MANGDKKVLIYVVLFVITISFAIDLQSFIKDYMIQSVIEDRVIVTFSPTPKIYMDIVKRKGEQMLVQTRTIDKEELVLFKNNKSYLLLPLKKFYVPINVVDPELLTFHLLKSKRDKIKEIFSNCVEIEGSNRKIRVFFEGDRFSKIEMYINGLPYKTITYTYYKNVQFKDTVFSIPKHYSLPENNKNIFDKLNNYYDQWCIKLFSPLIIEGFKQGATSLVIISKLPVDKGLLNALKTRVSDPSDIFIKKWEKYYIISIGKTPF